MSADSLHSPVALIRHSYLFAGSFLNTQLWFSPLYYEIRKTCGSGEPHGLMFCYGKPRALYLRTWLSSSGGRWCLSVLPCCPSEEDHVPPRDVGWVQLPWICGSPNSAAGGRMLWAIPAAWCLTPLRCFWPSCAQTRSAGHIFSVCLMHICQLPIHSQLWLMPDLSFLVPRAQFAPLVI